MCLKWFKPKPPVPPIPPIPPIPPEPGVRVFSGVYDLLGATGNIDAYLENCKLNGACGVRLFVCYSWNGPQPISPYAQAGTWVHDNGMTFPLYRLSEWNPGFWSYFEDVLRSIGGHGLTAWVVAEDYCSLKGDSRQKYYNPMYSSEEALGSTTPGGVWGEAMKVYHRALYRKIMESVDGVGVGYLFEDMNEGSIVDGTDVQIRDWFTWSKYAMLEVGANDYKIVTTVPLVAGESAYYSPHGIGLPVQITAPILDVPAEGLIYSSDGYWTGTGPADIKGRRGPGVDVAFDIGQRIIDIGAYGFEYLPRDAYRLNNDRGDVDGLDYSTIRDMSHVSI